MTDTHEPGGFTQIGAKAVIVRPNVMPLQLLCVQKQAQYNNQWELPGGRLSLQEEPVRALQRELLEELGYEQVTVGQLLAAAPAAPHPVWPPLFFLLYDVRIPDSPPTLSEEHQQWAWLTLEEIQAMTDGDSVFNPSLVTMLTELFG